MDMKMIGGLVVRHVLTAAGGALANYGLLAADGSQTETFVGAGLFLLGIGWSAWQKYGRVLVDAQLAKLKGVHP